MFSLVKMLNCCAVHLQIWCQEHGRSVESLTDGTGVRLNVLFRFS